MKSCGCKLCTKINKAIAQRMLKTDEVSEMATHILGIMAEVVDRPDNVRAFCVRCHAEIDVGRAKRREAIGLAPLCEGCAKATTKEYTGADIHGELVKTKNPNLRVCGDISQRKSRNPGMKGNPCWSGTASIVARGTSGSRIGDAANAGGNHDYLHTRQV